MEMTKETGTFAELNLQPGDVIEMIFNGIMKTVCYEKYVVSHGRLDSLTNLGQFRTLPCDNDHAFRVVSRAAPPKTGTLAPQFETPKPLRDMTDAEIGALARAQMQGKTLEWINPEDARDTWTKCELGFDKIGDDMAVRIRSEPKRETVDIFYIERDNLRPIGTIVLVDGEPDSASVKIEQV